MLNRANIRNASEKNDALIQSGDWVYCFDSLFFSSIAVLVAAPFFRDALLDLVQEPGGQGWQLAGAQFLSLGLQSAGLHDLASFTGVAVSVFSVLASQSIASVLVVAAAACEQEEVLTEVVVALAAQQDCACKEPQNKLKVTMLKEINNSFMIVKI